MSDTGHFITDVSDTARWTALHRATESARADALFSDPLAERLGGEHGRAIVARVFGRPPIPSLTDAHAPDCLAAADGSTAPGRQPLECGCTPYPLSSANG